METAEATITNLMDDNVYWGAILHKFVLSAVAVKKFTDKYSAGRYLMVSNITQINNVINQQKKMYHNHAGTNHHCYINATKINHIL